MAKVITQPQAVGSVGTHTVSVATGCSYRQIDYWCRNGVLLSEGGVGSGSRRKFPYTEVEIGYVVKAISRGVQPYSGRGGNGVAVELVQASAAQLRAMWPEEREPLLFDGGGLWFYPDGAVQVVGKGEPLVKPVGVGVGVAMFIEIPPMAVGGLGGPSGASVPGRILESGAYWQSELR